MNEHSAISEWGEQVAIEIRIRGCVQGVGFRPTVWRYAHEFHLNGDVRNNSRGVLIRAHGRKCELAAFTDRLRREPPPLATIDEIEAWPYLGTVAEGFHIIDSAGGGVHTQISPDATICAACATEVVDPSNRRYRYPFANCTHCGPRLTIVKGVPYDRSATTMAAFPMCEACRAEYRDPADRRFHAEPIACNECGPRARLLRLDGGASGAERDSSVDAVAAAAALILQGEIVAVKGLGGYHLACDATCGTTVARLRRLKRRETKPFALMARDLDVIRHYCLISPEEERQLTSSQAPITLLRAAGPERLPPDIAPGLNTLGFMLPTTPLHLLLLQHVDRPLVMTSGNHSEEPQLVDDEEARERLGGIARYSLTHDRAIANRVDDSVTRVMGGVSRVLRRARGFAPAPIQLPPGFEQSPDLLAFGGELKSTFCLVKDGAAILSQHQGDLENAATFDDYLGNLELYAQLFDHEPSAFVVDLHPDYMSTKLAQKRAERECRPLIEAQHHHAHVAACLAENGYPLNGAPVLGIVLDGLGWGSNGDIWGGEFLLADYRRYERLAALRPVAMPGSASAILEPWRNLYAYLVATLGWEQFTARFSDLEIHAYLMSKPIAALGAMMKTGFNSPKASSCGRLFDAVAAALDLCRDRQGYEGDAASRLEAIVDEHSLRHEDDSFAYPFTIARSGDAVGHYLETAAMWNALLGDLREGVPARIVAARFHKGLAKAAVAMAAKLAERGQLVRGFDTIALSGGCFQNKILFEEVLRRSEAAGFNVLSHAKTPANDGGLALGQAAIGAAAMIERPSGDAGDERKSGPFDRSESLSRRRRP